MGVFNDVLDFGKDLVSGVGIVDDLFGSKGDDARAERAWQFNRNESLQREFAQHGVRWRTEDAVRAGLHPLFALGAQPIQSSPQAVMDSGAGRVTAGETALRMASLDAAKAASARDFAQASYYDALAAKERQAAGAPFPDIGDAAGWVGGVSLGSGGGDLVHQGRDPSINAAIQPFFDRRRLDPSVVKSRHMSDPSLEAATGVGWKKWTLTDDGFDMVLPGSDTMSEALESLSESKLLMAWTLAENTRRFGAGWMPEFIKRYGSILGGN